MTEILLSRSWREEFAFAAETRREELAFKDELARFELRERQKREQHEIKDKREERETREMIANFLAPPQAVAAFRVELDSYDAKTVEALMQNQEALDAVRERIDGMLAQAQTLPDGRRVFRTRDGQQVFDEHGQAVSAEVIDPGSISSRRPFWEDFSAANRERDRLDEERRQLLEYQQKLDQARERLDRGEITQRELDRTREELSATMPQAVRQRVEAEWPRNEAAPATVAPAASLPDNMDDLMRRTGLGAPGMGQP